MRTSFPAFSAAGLTALVLSGAAIATPTPVPAPSSHREAPGIAGMPKVDSTDFYMFNSYEAGRRSFVTIIADYQPFQTPYGGPNFFQMDPFMANICEVASANYVGVFGTFEPGVGGDGIFFRNSAIALRDTTDGSSSTLMLGERSFRLGEATWVGAVTGAVIVPDGSDGVGTGPPESASSLVLGHSGDGYSPGNPRSHVNQFYSLHTGGVHFLFGDGHVSFLSSSLDYRVYQALTTRAGGEVVSDSY